MKTQIIAMLGIILLLGLVSATELSTSDMVLDFSENFSNGMPVDYITQGRATILSRGLQDIDISNKWEVLDGKLVATDYSNKTGGSMVFLFDNKTYSASEPYTFSAVVHRDTNGESEACKTISSIGLAFGYNETDKSFYEFSTSNNQGWFSKKTIGTTHSLCHSGCFDFYGVNLTGEHKLQVSVYDSHVVMIYNDKIVKDYQISIPDGKIGFYIWDSAGKNDPEFNGKNYFDNVQVYKSPTLEVINPKNNTEIKVDEKVNFSLEINATEPIVNATLVFEDENNKTEEIVFELNESLEQNITIEKEFKEEGLKSWYWKVVDWFGSWFNTEKRVIKVTKDDINLA